MQKLVEKAKALLAKVQQHQATHSEQAGELEARSDSLFDACLRVAKSWCGSAFGYHWNLYYADFEPPTLEDAFSVEWGRINGLSPNWRPRQPEEVKQRIQALCNVDPSALERDTRHLVELAKELHTELLVDLAPLHNFPGLLREKKLLDQIETWDWKDGARNNYTEAAIRSFPNMTRDSEAAIQGLRIPTHTHYEAIATQARANCGAVRDFWKNATRLLKQLEALEDRHLASAPQAGRNDIQKALDLYEKAKQHEGSLTKANAFLVIELCEDAIRLFGKSNQEKKVELRLWKLSAEELLAPTDSKAFLKRADRKALELFYRLPPRAIRILLPIIGVGLLAAGVVRLWNGFSVPLRPPVGGTRPSHFSGRIADIYDRALEPGHRKKLGNFVGEPYLYSGPKASRPGIGPGTTFTRFENGFAVYFKFDQDTNPGGQGGRSFFIEADGGVKWWLASHFARESSCWRPERPAAPGDRCKIAPECLEPLSGIGSVWRCNSEVRQSLGQPTTCETNSIIQIQEFDYGFLIADVPIPGSARCSSQPSLVQVETYVLFKKDVNAIKQSNVVFQGDGIKLRTSDIAVQTPAKWPIWTCTEAAPQLCNQ